VISAVSAILALAALAAADTPPASVVSIQRGDDEEAVVLEASLRLRSELATAGFAGEIVACTVDPVKGPVDCPQKDGQDSIALARVEGASSIFATSVLPSGRRTQRRLRVLDADGGNDATLIAVRAVELLRDAQLHVAASENDSEEPTPLEPFAQVPPRPPPTHWAILAGIGALNVPWATQVPLFPVFGATLGIGRPLGSRAYVLLQASGPYLTYVPIALENFQYVPQDRALIQFPVLAMVRESWSSPRSGPFAAVRAGARIIHVQLGAPNLNGPSDTTIILQAGFGLGWAVPVGARMFVTLEAHLDISPTVQIVDNTRPTPIVMDETGIWSGGLELTVAIEP
jgi:hypothetical protein